MYHFFQWVFFSLTYGSSTAQTWVGLAVLIQTTPFLLGSPWSLYSTTHLYHRSPEHTGGDNLLFSKAVFATICYGFSFIPSSVFLSSPHSHDFYRLDQPLYKFAFIHVPVSTPQSSREIMDHIFQDLRSIQEHNLTFKHCCRLFNYSRFLTISNW